MRGLIDMQESDIAFFFRVKSEGRKLEPPTRGSHLFERTPSSISGQREPTDSTVDITPEPPLTAMFSPFNLSKMYSLHHPNCPVDITLSINRSYLQTRHTLSVHNTFIRGREAQINTSSPQRAECVLSASHIQLDNKKNGALFIFKCT